MKLFNKDKKIGIAFGGGAARGIAEIGVVKAFEEAGIDFDIIAGNSIGSMVGAFYSYGLSWKDMYEFAKSIRRRDILKRSRLHLCFDSYNIEQIAAKILGDCEFSDLKKPFRAVAVDVKNGELVELHKGRVAKAISASCAFPGVFSPVEMGNNILVDGGILNSVPADIARKMGADFVVGVNLNKDRRQGTDSNGYFDVIQASFRILMSNNAERGKLESDAVIEPNLSNCSYSRISNIDDIIEKGEKAAKHAIRDLKKYLK